MEGVVSLRCPPLPLLHFGKLYGGGIVRLCRAHEGFVCRKEGFKGAVVVLQPWCVGIDEVHITAENVVVMLNRVLLAIDDLRFTHSVLKGLNAVVAPCLIIGAVGHFLIGWHTEVAQRKVIVQALKAEGVLVGLVAEHLFVELAVAEGTQATELNLAVVLRMLCEEQEVFFTYREADSRIVAVEMDFVATKGLHDVVIKTGCAHLMGLHRRSIVDFVDQLLALGAAYGGGIELAMVHAHLGHALAPAVSVKPAVHHINGHPCLLFVGKVGVARTFNALAIEIHGVGATFAGAHGSFPSKFGMDFRERNVDDKGDFVHLGLLVIVPIGVSRGALGRNHQAFLTIQGIGHVCEIGSLADGAA